MDLTIGAWMKKMTMAAALVVLVLLMTVSTGCGQKKVSTVPSEAEGADNLPMEGEVKGIRFIGDGQRPEQCPVGEHLIAFHRKGPDGYCDIYTMNPDGSNVTCLTDGKPELPSRHIGSASWHPSGQYIIFKAEKDEHIAGSALADPGIGLHNDIWLMTSDGQRFWKLVDIPSKRNIRDKTPITASLHPHFSHDGKKVSWSEGVFQDNGSSFWGKWVLKVADFSWDEATGVPKLENIITLQPGQQHSFYESNDFSLDDNQLLICGNLEQGQAEVGMDVYELDMNTQDLIRLTETVDCWDESGHYSPDGSRIAWLSSRGYATDFSNRNYWEWERTEAWLMDGDGTEQRSLTHFNTAGYTDYDLVEGKRVMVSYVSWSYDGKRLLLSIIAYNEDGTSSERLLEIDLKDSN